MAVNKKSFKVKVDGKDAEFEVRRPNNDQLQKAQLVYGRTFRQAVAPPDGGLGALVRAKVENIIKEQNLWDERKQKEYEESRKRLMSNELRLAKGGISKADGREIAIQMRKDRWLLDDLRAERNQLDLNTAEAQAENARFNYLVSVCTVYPNTGKPYWKNYDEYMSREDDPVMGPAANALASLVYGADEDFRKKLPENKFLLEHGFCNDKLHLVNADGDLINADGKLVDDQGRLVNEIGELVDTEGNVIDEDGNYVVQAEPFLD